MNDNKSIEEFLRENKPRVKDDPTFLLETQRRMKQVDGIKAEVDRQRVHGRIVLIVTLIIGIVLGATAVFVSYVYPIEANKVDAGLFDNIRLFIDTWKQYLIIPVAMLIAALSLVLSRGRKTEF